MRDVLDDVLPWYRAGQRFALATVVDTFRSAPRQPGACMAVSQGGEVVGSVSGGCVEGAVYELAQQVTASGRPATARYGVADDDAFAVGLTCGGVIDVLVEPVDAGSFPDLQALAEAVDSGRPVATATVVSGEHVGRRVVVWQDGVSGDLGDAALTEAVTADAADLLDRGSTAVRHYGAHGECDLADVAVFVQSFAPPPRMLVFGAIDFAAAVVRIGKFLGYRVTVCDARPVFTTERRFPDADDVVVSWPHRYLAELVALGRVDARTAICVLTHDPKFDVPLLAEALRTEAGYVGAMGSRRTNEERLRQLRGLGVPETDLSRLSAPIGLDLGARTPEETAVSIAAELVMVTGSGSGHRLSTTTGAIHGGTRGVDSLHNQTRSA